MKTLNVSRKALLIGCPGKIGNLLPGVNHDLKNVRQYLLSDKGGSWNPHEIEVLNNPTEVRLNQAIAGAKDDYLFVYFSGHGYTDAHKRRMISLNDRSIPDVNLLNESPRQLVIIDACRNFISSGIGSLNTQPDTANHFESFSTYELFSEQIMLSPPGKIIVHSTQSGYSSYDTRSGGVFTNNLLKVSARMTSDFDYCPCGIQTILKYVPEFINNAGYQQTPVLAYSEGNLSVPFALTMSHFEKESNHFNKSLETNRNGMNFESLVNAALVTLAVVCVVGAISSSK